MADPTPVHPLARRRVLVLVQGAQHYGREILRGIIESSRRHREWELLFDVQREPDLRAHGRRRFDGVISEFADPRRARWIARQRVPRVVISGARQVPGCGWVVADNRKVGRLALEHLYERGLRQFAVLGYRDTLSSQQRVAGLVEAAAARGLDASAIPARLLPPHGDYAAERPDLVPWIQSLPRPVGVFATTIDLARMASLCCQELDRRVPEEVAIIGCGDDPLVADMSEPPLSSIDHGPRQIGFASGELLRRMLRGAPPPDGPVVIEPLGVLTRESTDLLATSDPRIAAAIRLIRNGATRGLTVEMILNEIAMGRRSFEAEFRRVVGRSPHQQIIRVRIDHARHLLRTTSMSLDQVARACGYRYATQFATAFKERTGVTPSAFRAGRDADSLPRPAGSQHRSPSVQGGPRLAMPPSGRNPPWNAPS